MRVTSTLARADGGAIGAARHQTILEFTAGVEFARQKPPDGKQYRHNAKSNERPAPITVFFVVCGHYYARDCTSRIAVWNIFGVMEQAEFICI